MSKTRQERVEEAERVIAETMIKNRVAFCAPEEFEDGVSFVVPIEDLVQAPHSAMVH
jgi:hypothetical protein